MILLRLMAATSEGAHLLVRVAATAAAQVAGAASLVQRFLMAAPRQDNGGNTQSALPGRSALEFH